MLQAAKMRFVSHSSPPSSLNESSITRFSRVYNGSKTHFSERMRQEKTHFCVLEKRPSERKGAWEARGARGDRSGRRHTTAPAGPTGETFPQQARGAIWIATGIVCRNYPEFEMRRIPILYAYKNAIVSFASGTILYCSRRRIIMSLEVQLWTI